MVSSLDSLKDSIGGGSRSECELCLFCCSWSLTLVGNKGLIKDDIISGVCFPRKDDVMNELPSPLNVGVPKNPMVGGVTLLYISMDCLQYSEKEKKHCS